MDHARIHTSNTKTVRTFAWASFLNDLGSDMIYPIWPLFVTGVLGAPMAALGFLDGLGDAIVSISQAVSGALSDKWKKRRVFIWLGYLCGAVSRVGYAFSFVWWHLVPFRMLDRAGKMRGAPRDAMLADASTRANRGKHFGLVRAMDNLGAVVGILVTIFLFDRLGFTRLFMLAAIPSAIAVGLILYFIRETKQPVASPLYRGIQLRKLTGNLKLFFIISGVFALGSFSYSFLLVFAQQAGFRITFVPVLYLVFTLVASIVSLPFGALADAIGRKKVLWMGYAFWILACIGFIINPSPLYIVVAFVLYGLHKGALDAVQKVFVAECAPAAYRASVLGGYQMMIGLAALPASLLAGVLWDTMGMTAPFYFAIGLSAFAMLGFFFVKEQSEDDAKT